MADNIFEAVVEKTSIFKDRDSITPHYVPKELPFREKQISLIASILGVTLKNQKSDNVFLYGKTGSGKTATTRHVLQQLEEFAQEKQGNIKTVYMNCRNYNSKYKVLSRILKELQPGKDFLGYSGTFIYEQLTALTEDSGAAILIALDELDKIKDLDELIYTLTRSNDELKHGSITIIGISNQLNFKDRLDPRTKSSLCEQELLFPPYNAEELKAILKQRIELAFEKGTVEDSAINLAGAIAAQESGDARTAVMLMLRAGEMAEKQNLDKVSDKEVKAAKKKVEEEIIYNMVSTLPEQQQLVLYSIALLDSEKKGITKLSGDRKAVLLSGEVYDEYKKISKARNGNVVSIRWYRQYINELEMYGLIITTHSGKGQRGNTTLIKLGFDSGKIKKIIEQEIGN